MSAPSHYTAAGNFISAVQGGVDPRTGLYNLNLPLANINANAQMGPELSLSLMYSPLSKVNYGFGKGFRMNLSYFDKETRQLLLSNGEEYRVGFDHQVKQQKLKNFIFRKQDEDTFHIIFKTGIIEKLHRQRGDIYLPVEISSADGRKLKLSWDPKFSPARLTSVIDDLHTVLCSVDYPDNTSAKTVLTLLPEKTKHSYEMHFNFINERLVRVVSNAVDPEISWSFDYENVGPQELYRAITAVYSPTGLVEKVNYYTQTADSMEFPENANLPALPCVYRHVIAPGGSQPKIVTTWSYTKKNYLGKDAGFNLWQPDTDQMLNFFLRDYEYGSTEERLDDDGKIVCKVIRRYNSYHLLASETTIRDGKTHISKTDYHTIPGAKFDEQPAQFSLPKTLEKTWHESNFINENSFRAESTNYQFDETGNPIKLEKPDGTIVNYTYYPATGEDYNCPADPHGFVRYLKTQTVTPPQVFGDELASTTIFTWQKLDFLNGSGYAVMQNTVEQTMGNKKKLTSNTYYSNQSLPVLFGRLKHRTIALTPDKKQPEEFVNQNEFTYHLSDGNLTENTEFIGYDNLSTKETVIRNIWTGNVLSKSNPLEIETQYDYDKLGRLISRTLCAGTIYENITTWKHGIDSQGPSSIETNTFGNTIKIGFDGTGRAVRHEIYDDETSKWYETFSCNHNSLGEVVSGTTTDWLRQSDMQIALSSDITYDSWGEKKAVSFSNGQIEHELIDHIALTKSNYTEVRTQDTAVTSGITTTTLDKKTHLPIITELKHATGEQYSTIKNTWDGLGQLREEEDENNAITKRSYDEYGRVIKQILPDGCIVSQTYAAHLSGKNVTSISVTEPDINGKSRTWQLGSQTFDSLGRLTKCTVGGRSTVYEYRGASLVPSTIVLPSGKSIQYTYVPELGVISSVAAEGLTQTFHYDNKDGKLLTEQEDSAKTEYVWSQAGQLKEETFLNDSEQRSAKYTYTVKGAPVNTTDITGKQTQYIMDKLGRVTNIKDDDITVSLSYDTLGRMNKQTVSDETSHSILTTELAFDSFGREVSRTLSDNNGIKLILLQTFTKNNLLATRSTLKNGTQLLHECFNYDTRNRLISYSAAGSSLPVDSSGHQMIGQFYHYDALNNLTLVKTTFSDHSTNITTYFYDNENDPTQLSKVTNTNESYPQVIELTYDSEGNMTRDEAGRILNYDTTGRLISINDEKAGQRGTYKYDAQNRLICQNAANGYVQNLYYRGTELVNKVSSQKETRFIKNGHSCLAVKDDQGLTLTAGNGNDSLLWSKEASLSSEKSQFHIWAPYGSGDCDYRLPGFNGEHFDHVSGTYHLGNGYRAYNPVLMRFNCPDSLSPFGVGGINPYAYCAGDPINRIDPSGHLSGMAISGIVLGALGIALAIFTAGTSIAAAGSVMGAISAASTSSLVIGGVGVTSDVLSIASGAFEDSSPEVSSILGWVSLATGLVGATVGIASGVRSGIRSMRKINGSHRAQPEPLKSMFDVKKPELKLLSEAPKNQSKWHQVTDGNHIIFGADRKIYGYHIEEPISIIARRNSHRDISILTGSHGNRFGHNWQGLTATSRSGRRYGYTGRAQGLIEGKFTVWDRHTFGNDKFVKNLNRNVNIIDMDKMSATRYKHIITDKSNHVIIGHCFGINDEALRYFLGLDLNLPSYVGNI